VEVGAEVLRVAAELKKFRGKNAEVSTVFEERGTMLVGDSA
jgi:hypothetical protein